MLFDLVFFPPCFLIRYWLNTRKGGGTWRGISCQTNRITKGGKMGGNLEEQSRP
jgi:hypothetical protein